MPRIRTHHQSKMLTGYRNQSRCGIVHNTMLRLLAVALTCSLAVAGCGGDQAGTSPLATSTPALTASSAQSGTDETVDGGDEQPVSPAGIDTTLEFIELVNRSDGLRTTRWEVWSDWPSSDFVWLFAIPAGADVTFSDLTGYPEGAPNDPVAPGAAPSCERDSDDQLRCLLTFPDGVAALTTDITIDLPAGVDFPAFDGGYTVFGDWTTTVMQNTATGDQPPRFELDDDRDASSNTTTLLATG